MARAKQKFSHLRTKRLFINSATTPPKRELGPSMAERTRHSSRSMQIQASCPSRKRLTSRNLVMPIKTESTTFSSAPKLSAVATKPINKFWSPLQMSTKTQTSPEPPATRSFTTQKPADPSLPTGRSTRAKPEVPALFQARAARTLIPVQAPTPPAQAQTASQLSAVVPNSEIREKQITTNTIQTSIFITVLAFQGWRIAASLLSQDFTRLRSYRKKTIQLWPITLTNTSFRPAIKRDHYLNIFHALSSQYLIDRTSVHPRQPAANSL